MIFRIILRREVSSLGTNRSWWAILALLFVMTVLAAANGSARMSQIEADAARLNDGETTLRQSLRAAAARYDASPQGDPPAAVNPGNVGLSLLAHYAVMDFRPLAPLSVGQSDVQPTYYRVTAHPRHTFLNASEIHNPLTQIAGSFDVAFVLVFVLPILIIAVSFDLMSREKEGGTLALLAAQGVPLRSLILAKIAARAGIIVLTLLVLLAAAGVIIGADLADRQVLADLGMLFAVAAGYAFFWFALALIVNSFKGSSVTNGVVLANFWLVFVVVLPSFINVAATTLYPAPSRVELTTEVREASEVADREAAAARDAYLFDHPDLARAGASLDDFYLRVLATDARVEKAIEPILQRFGQQAEARERVVGGLRYSSPAVAAQEAFSALCGTDTGRFAELIGQVTTFHEIWRAFFARRIAAGARMKTADFDAIPDFRYRAPPTAEARRAVIGPLIYLLLVVAALVGVAAHRYARYPVV